MQVLDSLSPLKPIEQDNTKFEIPMITKDGKVTKILLSLKKKKDTDPKPELDISKFDYTNDPDYGEMFSKLDPFHPVLFITNMMVCYIGLIKDFKIKSVFQTTKE
eukprot:213368-Rhodomonas_salina.1